MRRVSFFKRKRVDSRFRGNDGGGSIYYNKALLSYPRKWVSILLLFVIIPLNAYEVIDIEKAKQYYETNSALFIDARDFKKYTKGTIAKAINVPLKRYKRFKKFLPIDKNAIIVTFCGGINCELSKKLSVKLERLGYTNIKQFANGYPKWRALNLPIMAKPIKCKNQKPKKVIVNGVELMLNSDSSINLEWLKKEGIKKKDITIVDVRKKVQFNKYHIQGAINLPFVNNKMDISQIKDKKVIIFYCNSGLISAMAKESLSNELKSKVFIVDESIKDFIY